MTPRPFRELVLTWDDDPLTTPRSWRHIAFVLAGAVLECAKALHRIADALEKDRA